MGHRKSIKHVGRSDDQKRDYVESVYGSSTAPSLEAKEEGDLSIDTIPEQNTGEMEKIKDGKSTKAVTSRKSNEPYRSPRTKLSDLIERHLYKILGTFFTIVIAVIGYLYVSQYRNNRELGEIQTRLIGVERGIGDLNTNYKDLGNRQSTFDKTISLIQKDIDYIQRLIK